MRTNVGSSLISGVIAAVLWIVISFATGAQAVFALVGGLVCGAVVFVIGYVFRVLVLDRRRAPR
jgi:O-antigen/teichoic acid export membrane protein